MAKRIAIVFLALSLALLIIYGADVMVASSSVSGNPLAERRGFLPFDEATRGGAFGGVAVILSIIAFVIGRKDYSPIISVLLFVNGGLIIAGMLALIAQGALASEDSSGALRTVGSTMAMGVLLVGLGLWKAVGDRKRLPATRKESPQN
ncbi:MAG TPA: hypothetical protein VGQ03_03440 [Nitrososphaera sp.]|nr:hypothetical protein [Nitrososphaera sp.]